jgi:hypothetical protein
LAAKSCWRGLFGNSLWSRILKQKYLKGVDLNSWLHKDDCNFLVASIIWIFFMSSMHIIKRWLAWKIGYGKKVIIEKGPFIGDNASFKL